MLAGVGKNRHDKKFGKEKWGTGREQEAICSSYNSISMCEQLQSHIIALQDFQRPLNLSPAQMADHGRP